MIKTDEDDSEKSADKMQKTQLTVRLDEEHYEALRRIADFEKLNLSGAMLKLIRIADQMISGDESPFASRLEHLLLPRKAG